ncbi:hypothetical protein EGW08_020624, partial [Elysia chlorotica]
SSEQGLQWLFIVLGVFFLNFVILEPLVIAGAAIASIHLYPTPTVIEECIERFTGVAQDLDYKHWMEDFRLSDRRRTCFIHTQATPDTVGLFHLHNKIHKALTRVTKLPQITFHKGVYWLIFYTMCALVLVNIQSDIFRSNQQKNHIKSTLMLPPL